jgi:hypothetical protein
MTRHIKSEKELTRIVWRAMGLGQHNADLKRRRGAAEEIHKAYEYAMNTLLPLHWSSVKEIKCLYPESYATIYALQE